MEEITYDNILFKQIKDFPNYYVSKCGKVLSTKYVEPRILIYAIDKDGYSKVCLFKLNLNKNNKRQYFIHRLVAQAFIPNLENKPQVNHINGIKTDNSLENLEWCTISENVLHSFRILKRTHSKPFLNKFSKNHNVSKKVNQYDMQGNLIKTWDCARDASRIDNFNYRCISSVCNYINKQHKGFIWRFN